MVFVVFALFALIQGPVMRRWRASQLLLALSAQHGKGQPQSADVVVLERDVTIAGSTGPIRARLYRRADMVRAPGLVVAHGVHYRGIDERRLVPFARELARAGRVVLTPLLADLADYRITPDGVTVIMDAVTWLSAQRNLVSTPRVGLMGFSFAGGLALVAASRPELEDKLEWVTSIGGHHDLSRVLHFLVSDEIQTPRGPVHEKAHEYGLLVAVYGSLEHFVEPPDQETLRDALRSWLHEDRAAAVTRASQRRTGSGEHLFVLLESGRLGTLRPALERLFDERRADLAALSPSGRLSRIGVPVYLLHGSADSVIPPSETQWADRELTDEPHQALISPLLEHVEVNKSAALGHQIALVDFMARML